MKLEITLCYSVIEYFLENQIVMQRDHDINELRDELFRRMIILHPELEEYWEEYFLNERPEYLDLYMTFISDFVQYEGSYKVLDHYTISNHVDQFIDASDEYRRLLYNICFSTKDKLLFTNLLDDLLTDANCEVEIFNLARIVDRDMAHKLNEYRLPITNKQVHLGDCSHTLSRWLKAFVEGEEELIICDNYIYQNRDNLYKYLLLHLTPGTKIKLYTLPINTTRRILKTTFTQPPFDRWDFEIYIINHRRYHHSREIVTSQFIINLEKGLALFGRPGSGVTDQSLININYHRGNIFPLPPSSKIL